ncbi:MAG: hypothetical protein CMF75_10655, partial [Maricaulis sp.]|nr:hypothetical protein [Maricaulis sp.]
MHRRTVLLALAGLGVSALPTAQAAQWGLTERQARDGVRAALSQAARLATNQLGQRDGFFGDPQVHIPLPSQIRSVQSMLRR